MAAEPLPAALGSGSALDSGGTLGSGALGSSALDSNALDSGAADLDANASDSAAVSDLDTEASGLV